MTTQGASKADIDQVFHRQIHEKIGNSGACVFVRVITMRKLWPYLGTILNLDLI